MVMMHRRGAAEIEFIMVLPILMLMFMGLVWAGRVSIARAATSVAMRHDAWNARKGVHHEPFNFSNTTAGIAEASADITVHVSTPSVSTSATASASVYGDAWGTPSVTLSKPPHWQLMAEVIRAGGANEVVHIESVAGSLVAAISQFFSISGSISGIDSLITNFQQQLGESKANLEERRRQAAARAEQAIAEVRSKMSELDRKIKLLEGDVAKAKTLPLPDRNAALEAAQKALENTRLRRAVYEEIVQQALKDTGPRP